MRASMTAELVFQVLSHTVILSYCRFTPARCCSLDCEDCRVPASNLVGDEGRQSQRAFIGIVTSQGAS